MNLRIVVAVTALAVSAATDCWAWGATGYEWISGIAIEKLPDGVPAFVRTPEAAAEIAVLGRELDRSKGAGKTHDAERDPGPLTSTWPSPRRVKRLPVVALCSIEDPFGLFAHPLPQAAGVKLRRVTRERVALLTVSLSVV